VTDQASPDGNRFGNIPHQESVAAPVSMPSIAAFCIRCGRGGYMTPSRTEVNVNNEPTYRPATQEQEYVRRALRAYVALPETPERWNATDRRIALDLYRRRVPIAVIETAFVLGSARRLGRDPNRVVPPIRCLAYFVPVIEEVIDLPPAAGYIDYLRWGLPRQVMKLGLKVTANSSK